METVTGSEPAVHREPRSRHALIPPPLSLEESGWHPSAPLPFAPSSQRAGAAAEPALNVFLSSHIAITSPSELILLRRKEVARDQHQLVLKALPDISLHFALQTEGFDLTKHTKSGEKAPHLLSGTAWYKSIPIPSQSYAQKLTDESQSGSFPAIPYNILLRRGTGMCSPRQDHPSSSARSCVRSHISHAQLLCSLHRARQ